MPTPVRWHQIIRLGSVRTASTASKCIGALPRIQGQSLITHPDTGVDRPLNDSPAMNAARSFRQRLESILEVPFPATGLRSSCGVKRHRGRCADARGMSSAARQCVHVRRWRRRYGERPSTAPVTHSQITHFLAVPTTERRATSSALTLHSFYIYLMRLPCNLHPPLRVVTDMLFVLARRSGTTWLANIFDSHRTAFISEPLPRLSPLSAFNEFIHRSRRPSRRGCAMISRGWWRSVRASSIRCMRAGGSSRPRRGSWARSNGGPAARASGRPRLRRS
jgi:hypothetical protein